MPLYNLPNSTTGIDNIMVDVVREVPSFIPALLFFVFMTIFLSGSINQKKRTGSADTPMWATIAGLSTLMIALPLSLVSGMINVITLSVVVVVTIASGFWLFMNRSRSEAF